MSIRILLHSRTHAAHPDPCSTARLTRLIRIPAAQPDSLGSSGSLQHSRTHSAHPDSCSTAGLTRLIWIPAAQPDSLGSSGSLQHSRTHSAHPDPCSTAGFNRLTRFLQLNWTHTAHLDPGRTAGLSRLIWMSAAQPDSHGSPGFQQNSLTHLAHQNPCSYRSQQSSSGLVQSAVLNSDADHWPGFFLHIQYQLQLFTLRDHRWGDPCGGSSNIAKDV
jgi:hypothetical protein